MEKAARVDLLERIERWMIATDHEEPPPLTELRTLFADYDALEELARDKHGIAALETRIAALETKLAAKPWVEAKALVDAETERCVEVVERTCPAPGVCEDCVAIVAALREGI